MPTVGAITTHVGSELAAESVGGVTVGKARVVAESRAMGDILVEIGTSDGVLVEFFVAPSREAAYQPAANWGLTVRDAAGRVAYSNAAVSNAQATRVSLNFPVQGALFCNASNLGSGKRVEMIVHLHTGPLAGGGTTLATDVDYTPADVTDWTGATDPGNIDGALDQLAQRETDHAAATTDPHGASMTLTGTTTLGTGGDTLTIDPAAGTITPAGTASPVDFPGLVVPHLGIHQGSGQWTCGQGEGPMNGATSILVDTLYCIPTLVGRRIVIDALSVSVTAQAGQRIRLGIYNSLTASGLPGSLLAEATEIVTTADSVLEIATLGSNLTLDPGLYYRALVADAGALSLIASYVFGHQIPMAFPVQSGWIVSNSQQGSRSYTYAALPSIWGTPSYTAGETRTPRIAMREA